MARDPYLVLARKWRPQSFEDVVGQEHITRTLQNSIESGRIGHAFLFIGSRGIGKTTTARILAKALNCESADKPTPNPCGTCDNCRTIAAGTSIDVLEIDGASNNSVEDVRQIRENVRLVPSRSRFKIYVIDEVHQLSAFAFNALLKTLEEPPEHAVFILATTEAHKVPATIVSRCQRYDFRRVKLDGIRKLLRQILDAEKIKCSDEALYAIARAADGGIRDAESILEQLISYCDDEITFQDVFDVLGLVDWKILQRLCSAMIEKDIPAQLRIVEEIVANGKDLSQFVQDILQYFRNLLVCKSADARSLIALPDDEIAVMSEMAAKFTLTDLIRMVEQFAELAKDFDSQLAQRIALESLLIRISKVSIEVSVDAVLEKLAALGVGGIPRPPSPPPSGGAHASKATKSGAAAAQAAPSAGGSGKPDPKGGRKITVTEENMRRAWAQVAQVAGERSLNLGVNLGQAVPIALRGDTIVIRFAEQFARSKSVVSRPDNIEALNAVLREVTRNVVQCEIDAEHHEEESPVESAGHTGFVHRQVNPEEAREALADPHIAKVVEVFRGRIVDIKRGTRTAEG
jgi:DNA polymerase-3 subunit gamma/tau